MQHARTIETSATRCRHCEGPLGPGAEGEYCCRGCARVHAMLVGEGLERYYALRGGRGEPPASIDPSLRDHKWLEPWIEKLEASEGLERIDLDVQGLHCAACVWVIGEVFDRHEEGARCEVNPTRGRISLTVARGFALPRFVDTLEALGYLIGPPLKQASRSSDALTLRMGISVALAMNTMVFALAIYLGLSEGPVYELVRQLSFALAFTTVLVGGSYFIHRAWQALRRGLWHLDLPIALGIVLATAGSSWSFFARGGADYFDTLAIFVALMLVGRWLEERVVAQNRARLLESDGVEGLFTRIYEGGRARLARAVELRAGDTLLIAPGDLVPVDATLDSPTRLRLDWINGESAPKRFAANATAPAGAFSADTRPVRAVAKSDFAESPLVELLATPTLRSEGASARFWDRLARLYVLGVLLAASLAFGLWMSLGADLARALSITTAVLVVTCPCAFGIAVPLARELAHAALRRGGLFVREASLLERATGVRQVVFDKTGTLTTAKVTLEAPEALEALSAREARVLRELVSQSSHPKSEAVLAALGPGPLDPNREVREVPGAGLETVVGSRLYRLGRPDWALGPGATTAEGADLVFAVDGEVVLALRTREEARPDAREELARLEAAGVRPWISSGDLPAKVRALATELGVPETRAFGGASPEEKARFVRSVGADETLFIGDGINDSFAAEAALCSGTPAIDRPFMPARTDFYFVTPGLAPIRRMLETAARLRRVIRADLAFAILYNVGAVTLAILGYIEPWVAAVLMPLSSLVVIGATTFALGRRAPWRS